MSNPTKPTLEQTVPSLKPPEQTVPPDLRRPVSGSAKVQGFQTAKGFGPKPTGKGQQK